ncbi:hypothetical protein KJ966_30755 [bacterium]|nr:hypothetical protein [bacterium]
MTGIKSRSFISPVDFFKKFFRIFRVPGFRVTFKTINAGLREKILLTVSIANNCAQ